MTIKPKIRMNIQLLADNDDNKDVSLESKIIELQDKLDKMDEIIKENEKLKKTNEMLFEKNQQYFLRITGSVNDEEENQTNEYEEFVGADFYKTLSTKEKNQLKIILEGEDE